MVGEKRIFGICIVTTQFCKCPKPELRTHLLEGGIIKTNLWYKQRDHKSCRTIEWLLLYKLYIGNCDDLKQNTLVNCFK